MTYPMPSQPEWLTDPIVEQLQARYQAELLDAQDAEDEGGAVIPLVDVPDQAAAIVEAVGARDPQVTLLFQATGLPLPVPRLLCARAFGVPPLEVARRLQDYLAYLAPILQAARATAAPAWQAATARPGWQPSVRALIIWHLPPAWRVRLALADADMLILDVLCRLLALPHAGIGEIVADVDGAAAQASVDVCLWLVETAVLV